MTASPEIRIAETAEDAVSLAVGEWRTALEGGTPERPRRALLAGGTTPASLYRALAEPGRVPRASWRSIECFFGDERCVPPDHPDSNDGMVRRALLRPLGDDAPRVHRMRGEAPDPERAAREYEALMRERFQTPPPDVPSFDLALLGLGGDGHTASLFPGVMPDPERLVVPVTKPGDGSTRITVTYRLLHEARVLLFFVLGAAKAAAVASTLRSRAQDPTPAALAMAGRGRSIWVLDRAAASVVLV
jgi:6-phosphogluconolactonase